ncbi:MAG TPA: ChbG/HpnK family deacetylase [Candidatus Paceibacterota bacterium]|jgi:predicted glycoside hydrolase/deacetylase ChbG (UPF0249 family)/putative flippase GtrA|nr:ChbG/HpnK family deacetylase [Candidatus Paceibacterota bacterium]
MTPRLTITADDFGLTRGVTDTILKAADHGALNHVSLLANGLAFDYAVARLLERPELGLSVHLNLTEGPALTPAHKAPHLLDSRGRFRFGPARLFAYSILAGKKTRQALAQEISAELARQVERVRAAVPGRPLCVDGHQHVHMTPLVRDIVCKLHARYRFVSARLPHEPFFWDAQSWSEYPKGVIRHAGLNMLARRARKHFAVAGLTHPDFFVGTLMSGRLTTSNVRQALAAGWGSSAEVGTHPGEALVGELIQWTGDTDWHYSPWRAREGAMLRASDFPTTLLAVSSGNPGRIARFIMSGALAFAVNIALLYVFVDWLGWWYLYATVVAWVLSFTVSFAAQKWWTFKDSHAAVGRQAGWYLALQGLNAVLNVVAMYVLVDFAHVWYIAAQVFVALALAVWTYFISHRFIFTCPGL